MSDADGRWLHGLPQLNGKVTLQAFPYLIRFPATTEMRMCPIRHRCRYVKRWNGEWKFASTIAADKQLLEKVY